MKYLNSSKHIPIKVTTKMQHTIHDHRIVKNISLNRAILSHAMEENHVKNAKDNTHIN